MPSDFALLDEHDPRIDEQLTEAYVEHIRENGVASAQPDWFRPVDADIADALGDGDPSQARYGVISDRRTKEFVRLYSNLDGEPRDILVYMLKGAVKKRLPDGRPAFSRTQPEWYRKGEFKCWLHPESAERALVQQVGITRTCPAAHIKTKLDQELHMQHRHKQEWGQIERHKADERLADEREWQRAILERLAPAAAAPARKGA